MNKPAFPQGGQRHWKTSGTGYKTPTYDKSNTVSEKRNSAATGAQPMYQGGGTAKAATTPKKGQ